MRRGKNICHKLKAVRRRIADENGIELRQPECTYEGECRGTCPRCEYELRYLERELSRRLLLGKAVTAAGLTLGLASCGGKGTASSSIITSHADDEYEIIQTGGIEEDDNENEVPNTVEEDTLELEGLAIPNTIDEGGVDEQSYAFRMKNGSRWESNENNHDVMVPEEQEEDEEEMLLGMINEKYPVFPGGEDSLYSFLARNIKYPTEADVTGTVVIKFTIEKDGSITNATILREIGGGCGEEALRVVNLMPKWIPGEMDGKPIRTEFILPVQFQIKQ